MSNKKDLAKLPSRVRYYLLEWKDNNMSDYIRKYNTTRLHELSLEQLLALFVYATNKDREILNEIIHIHSIN